MEGAINPFFVDLCINFYGIGGATIRRFTAACLVLPGNFPNNDFSPFIFQIKNFRTHICTQAAHDTIFVYISFHQITSFSTVLRLLANRLPDRLICTNGKHNEGRGKANGKNIDHCQNYVKSAVAMEQVMEANKPGDHTEDHQQTPD